MKVITAPNEYIPNENDIKVFLAGGITNCRNWQKEVIDEFMQYVKVFHCNDDLYDRLVIFNPRRDSFSINDFEAAQKQIEWEFYALEKADIFSIYFCNSDSDQPICMYELGRNIERMKQKFPKDYYERIIITCEAGYKRTQDVLIQTLLATVALVGPSINLNHHDAVINHMTNLIEAYIRISQRENA